MKALLLIVVVLVISKWLIPPLLDAVWERADEEEGIELGAQALAELAGDYYSEELDVVYAIRQTDQGLELSVASQPPLALIALEPDVLRAQFLTLRIERNTAGAIAGFQLDAGRVQNLRFVRVGQ